MGRVERKDDEERVIADDRCAISVVEQVTVRIRFLVIDVYGGDGPRSQTGDIAVHIVEPRPDIGFGVPGYETGVQPVGHVPRAPHPLGPAYRPGDLGVTEEGQQSCHGDNPAVVAAAGRAIAAGVDEVRDRARPWVEPSDEFPRGKSGSVFQRDLEVMVFEWHQLRPATRHRVRGFDIGNCQPESAQPGFSGDEQQVVLIDNRVRVRGICRCEAEMCTQVECEAMPSGVDVERRIETPGAQMRDLEVLDKVEAEPNRLTGSGRVPGAVPEDLAVRGVDDRLDSSRIGTRRRIVVDVQAGTELERCSVRGHRANDVEGGSRDGGSCRRRLSDARSGVLRMRSTGLRVRAAVIEAVIVRVGSQIGIGDVDATVFVDEYPVEEDLFTTCESVPVVLFRQSAQMRIGPREGDQHATGFPRQHTDALVGLTDACRGKDIGDRKLGGRVRQLSRVRACGAIPREMLCRCVSQCVERTDFLVPGDSVGLRHTVASDGLPR
ncbi:hypothetical protein [Nocardia caishijiensis]|uniref:hypothetical protein n=1 Tax=Nocardia caishijiensis TaxID=184756 RepID=UPI001428ABFE|nr:hypothetical protein [Nocardia caishijiensis]